MPGPRAEQMAVIDEEIARAQAKPVDAAELDRAKNQLGIGHRAQPREPARARRAPAVIQLHGRRPRLPHRGPAPVTAPSTPPPSSAPRSSTCKGRARDRQRSIPNPRSARSSDGSEMIAPGSSDLSRRALLPVLSLSCASAPAPGAIRAARNRRHPAAPGGQRRRAPMPTAAPASAARETPDAPFRQLAPPGGRRAHVQAPRSRSASS